MELDVRLSRNGDVVVIHDDNLKRITGLDARVEECSTGQLRVLDAGAWFDRSFRGERVPLLDEVFELLANRVYYDLDLKWGRRGSGGLEAAVIKRIRAHGLEDRCLLSSFNPYCIRTVRRLAPELPTAHIYARHPSLPVVLRRGWVRLVIPTPLVKPHSPQIRPLSAFLYKYLLKSKVVAWTVDDLDEARRLVRLGVGGIISNDPGRIKTLISR